MANIWTEEQLKVIETRDRNILVSAAAGSGKTAVLVERIVKMVTDSFNPVDVDKLLVVTFTNAAAAEMRERVMKSLGKALSKDKNNEHLQRQMTYIHNAKITTIDSFCLNIVKEHFGEINLDPGFRIGNKDELELLKADVLNDLLDRYFEEGDSEFLKFVDTYVSKQGKSKIEEIILKLFEQSMSEKYPKNWLNGLITGYEDISEKKIKESAWFKLLVNDAKNSLTGNLEGMYKAVEIAGEDKGPQKYLDILNAEIIFLKEIIACDGFETVKETINGFEFGRMPAITKKDDVDEAKKETVKALRNEFKDTLNKLKKGMFSGSLEEYKIIIENCRDSVKMLVRLTIEFMEEYVAVKREKNLTDFAEIEHFALDILVKEGNITETAKEISGEFYEILIDEYQDSNYVQEEILNAVSKKHKGINNIFMVGDVKQSIYGFRQAKPELFLEKYDTYTSDDDKNMKICLSKNFRSRDEVIDTCNLIFSQIMVRDLGGISYDEEQSLYPGAEYQHAENMETEVIVIDTQDSHIADINETEEEDELNTEGTKTEIEATVIADRIDKLIKSDFKVTDKSTKKLRPIKYSDIAIIVRSIRSFGDTVANVLQNRNIPVESITTTGYFDAFEIKALLNYLLIVDNPRQDIPLVGVLRNIYRFSENELAIIRGERQGIFFKAMEEYEGYLKERVDKVLLDIEVFRRMAAYSSIYDLINQILMTTGFRDFVLAMGNGNRRTANIEMLLEKAVQYESSSFSGLFNFVRYIEKIRKVELDEGEANVAENGNNCVKLMTIHKSKGLEFPIVILAGTGKKFNETDFNKEVIVKEEIGLGIDYVDKEKSIKYKSPIKKAAAIKGRYDNKAEELRVLYVALTRAKEKLIIVGSDKLDTKIKKIVRSLEWKDVDFGTNAIVECHSYMDMILLALSRHKSMKDILWRYDINPQIGSPVYDMADSIKVSVINTGDVVYDAVKRIYISDVNRRSIENFNTNTVYDEKTNEILKENMKFIYEYGDAIGLVAKVSVSDVKHTYMVDKYEDLMEEGEAVLEFSIQNEQSSNINGDKEDFKNLSSDENALGTAEDYGEDTDKDMPEFLKEIKETDGATRGTAYHRIFELIDYKREISSVEDVENMISDIISTGKISGDEAELVDAYKIYKFLLSGIGIRMKKAFLNGKLYREKQFVMGNDYNKVYKEKNSSELLLIQGIIDAMFEEEDGIVILDYKTDNVRNIKDLESRYKKQLLLYADAVRLSLGKNVKEMVIYSTKFDEELIINDIIGS